MTFQPRWETGGISRRDLAEIRLAAAAGIASTDPERAREMRASARLAAWRDGWARPRSWKTEEGSDGGRQEAQAD